MITQVQYNERGLRIGQHHHRAKLSDHDIELIFQMRQEFSTLKEIATRMECGKTTVWKILKGDIRGQAVFRAAMRKQ